MIYGDITTTNPMTTLGRCTRPNISAFLNAAKLPMVNLASSGNMQNIIIANIIEKIVRSPIRIGPIICVPLRIMSHQSNAKNPTTSKRIKVIQVF